jgi:hypothetical protein
VKHEDDVLAVGPLLDFAANYLRQVNGSDVFNGVVFVDDHGRVVGESKA